MSHFVILASVFAIFIPALLLPGPDFIAVVRSSMVRGTAAGLLTTLGVSIGLVFYATLSLLITATQLFEIEDRVLNGFSEQLGGANRHLSQSMWSTMPTIAAFAGASLRSIAMDVDRPSTTTSTVSPAPAPTVSTTSAGTPGWSKVP